MGHYDGVEERIAEKRAENDLIIKPLSARQFVAAYLKAEMMDAQREIDYAMRRLKDLHDQLKRLGIKPKNKAVEVLHSSGGDYSYKISHDPEVKKILKSLSDD